MEASAHLDMVNDHQTSDRATRFIAATDAVMDRIVAMHSKIETGTVDSMDRMVRHLEIMLRDDWLKAAAGTAIVQAWQEAAAIGRQWIEDNT
jgi:acyl carrier protein phosphodiesterase